MFETLTLDQLRLFLSVAEEGSFSAAGRRIGRVQSAVSQGVANLESSLGVTLFDRSGRRPTLTIQGRALLIDAQRVFAQVGQLRAHAATIGGGLEGRVSVVVDAIVPAGLLVEICRRFQAQFPSVPLRIYTEVLDSVADLVRNGTCQVGISGPIGVDDPSLTRQFLTHVAMLPVAGSDHPLALIPQPVATDVVREHVQVVISQRDRAAEGDVDHAVLSRHPWRVADTATKLALIRAGLGWGNLVAEMVDADIEAGNLVRLELEEWGPQPMLVPLSTIIRTDSPPGPAGQWLLETLRDDRRSI